MLVLGRADMLNPLLELDPISPEMDKRNFPVVMPDVGSNRIVILAVNYADGVVKLVACNSLKEMRTELTWALVSAHTYGATGCSWLAADVDQCKLAYMNRETDG